MSHGPLSDLSHITWQRAERRWFRVLGAAVTLLVFSAGFAGLLLAEGERLGPVACLYATFKFFLFHGEAESLSREHGPLAVALVSVAAFGGPVLTTAVIALLVRQLATVLRDRQAVRASGHAVVFGSDREGVHWGSYLCRAHKLPVVFVDQKDEGPQHGRARALGKALLVGDMRDAATRRRAAVHRSKFVVVCTGNEVANIDTARAIEREARERGDGAGGPTVFCRVSSQSLLYSMYRSARESSSQIRYFNIYDFVARDAIRATLESAAGAGKDFGRVHLIICGFGRFGQAVLHEAGADEALFPRLAAVDVVDLRADELLSEYRFSAPRSDEAVLGLTSPRRSGVLSRGLWDELLAQAAGALRLVFICTDNDVTNLVHALAIQRLVLRRESGKVRAIVVLRQFERPLSSEAGLLYASMGESTDAQIERLIADPA